MIFEVPYSRFEVHDIPQMVGRQAQKIGMDEFAQLGFPQVATQGEDGDGLIYNPHENLVKVSDIDFDFPYVCTHKRESKPGKALTFL